MKNAIAAAFRATVVRSLGQERLAAAVRKVARVGEIDLRGLANELDGILKYENLDRSGEAFLIGRLLGEGRTEPHPVVIDVGANVGDYSKMVCRVCPRARVFALEPNPYTFQILVKTLEGTGARCVPVGLGHRDGTGELFVYPGDRTTGHASNSAELLSVFHRCREPLPVEVSVTTLDAFAQAENLERIALLKIDTEGAELDVLNGARQLLARDMIDFIQFEFGECDVFARVFLRDFYDLLGSSYSFYRLNSDRLIPLGPWSPRHEIFQFQNIVAVHRDWKFEGAWWPKRVRPPSVVRQTESKRE